MGVLGLLVSAHLIVKLAERVAVGYGVSLLVVGLILVALGTSLPELIFEFKAVKSKEVGMVFGDLLGSLVANSTLIIGTVGMIHPFSLDGGFQPYLRGTITFLVLFGLFWWLATTKRKLERWEGLILLLIYGVFLWLEVGS